MEEDVRFIKEDLLPEMVYDRCFCDSGSREFVEFDSAQVVVSNCRAGNDECNYANTYKGLVSVRFSGNVQQFPVVVKLLPIGEDGLAFEAFQNEEMLYSKMTSKYGKEKFPKCYVADLGRYGGRSVIVIEDLEAKGYRRVDGKFTGDHVKLAMRAIGRFHGRGLNLRKNDFAGFREFYAKLIEVELLDESLESFIRTMEQCNAQEVKDFATFKSQVTRVNELSTICHGSLTKANILFKCNEGSSRPVDAMIVNYQSLRFGSIGLDIGSVLMDNLTIDQLSDHSLFTEYLKGVKEEYEGITKDCEKLLAKEFTSNFMYGYFILSRANSTTNTFDTSKIAQLKLCRLNEMSL